MFDFIKKLFGFNSPKEQPVKQWVTTEKAGSNRLRATIDCEEVVVQSLKNSGYKEDEVRPVVKEVLSDYIPEEQSLELTDEEIARHVSSDIHTVVCSLSKIEKDTYPINVYKNYKDAVDAHNCIFSNSPHIIKLAFKDYARDTFNYISEDAQMLFMAYRLKKEKFDFNAVLKKSFTTYFDNYPIYWEAQILELKQTAAKIKRRQYLVEQIDEFIRFMDSIGHSSYNKKLTDYKNFNLARLQKLELSKNSK